MPETIGDVLAAMKEHEKVWPVNGALVARLEAAINSAEGRVLKSARAAAAGPTGRISRAIRAELGTPGGDHVEDETKRD